MALLSNPSVTNQYLGLREMTLAPEPPAKAAPREPMQRSTGQPRHDTALTGGLLDPGVPDLSLYPQGREPSGGILYNSASSHLARTLPGESVDFSALGPHTREVSPEETVQHQLQGLLSQDSPYMRQAELAGQRAAAARGALSSSMFAGASQAAAIQAALPIAAQDAQTYSRVASENAAAINQNTLAKMQSMSQLAATAIGANAQLASSSIAANANMEIARMRIVADQDARLFMAAHDQIMNQLQHGQQVQLATLDFGFRQQLMQAGFNHEFSMADLTQQQRIQLQNLAHEHGLEQIGYQGTVQNFLQDQQLRAGFFNNAMGNVFNSINTISQLGLDGPGFNTATQNVWNQFNTFMGLFNNLNDRGMNINFGATPSTGGGG